MKRKINNIKLYIKNSDNAKKIAIIVQEKLKENGFKIVSRNYDLAISIGGDGTFLKMIQENKFNNEIYYVGINAGALGYLTSIDIEDIDKFIKSINDNNFKEVNSCIIRNKIITNKEKKEYYSLNETIIKKINQSTLKTDIYINDTLLEHFVGDGILISSANGSTAYNMSLNGPILDIDIKALVITPIAPINNKIFNNLSNSIVISNNKKIIIDLKNKENMCVINDGKVININNVLKIETNISNKNIKLINFDGNYIKKISTKIIGN